MCVVQIISFTLVAIFLYLFSDWALRQIEARRGSPLPNRNVIFFVIIMTLSLVTFELLQQFLQQTG